MIDRGAADAIAQLVADTSHAADAKIAALERRVAALEARPQLAYVGVYQRGQTYRAQSAATHKGSLWICSEDTDAVPGDGPSPWRLAAKRGRDGKDGRNHDDTR